MSSTRGLIADTVTFSSVDGPGNRFVVFMQGCNFDCLACHNPQTIPSSSRFARDTDVATLVDEIRAAAPFLSGVTVSGGEGTVQALFVHDLFEALKADPRLARLSCLIDSNGAAEPATWDLLAPVMDGAMIDLKSLDPDIHLSLTGHGNEAVLASIRRLSEMGLLHEVRLLLIAGVNDAPDLLRHTATWLAAVDPTMRVRLIAFRGHGVRHHVPALVEPSPIEMNEAAGIIRDAASFDLCIV